MDPWTALRRPDGAEAELRRHNELRGGFEDTVLAQLLAERLREARSVLRPISGRVLAATGALNDVRRLADGGGDVPPEWRLSNEESARVSELAFGVMESLDAEPRRGELLRARPGAEFLSICRRLRFDPAESPPLDLHGRARPRLSVVWTNLPSRPSITRVLAVVHRYDWQLRRPAPAGAWSIRRASVAT